MTPSLTLPAFAKINLHLEITGTRPDGYHEVDSIMQSITLHDTLTIAPAAHISMTCSDPDLSCGEDNLVLRAANAFFARSGIEGGARIHLTKRIPSQAGMGGGSSDAAATLRGLNTLFHAPLKGDQLHEIASRLGADVPFCLGIVPARAGGIGTDLSSAPGLPPCTLLLAMGAGDKMSTRAAYAALDAMEFQPRSASDLLRALENGDRCAAEALLFNRFTALNPAAVRGMERLTALGASSTLLCGSGAAFFGIFSSDGHAEDAAQILQKEGYRTWIAHPIC